MFHRLRAWLGRRDRVAQAKAYEVMLASNVMTRDEVRQEIGLGPIPLDWIVRQEHEMWWPRSPDRPVGWWLDGDGCADCVLPASFLLDGDEYTCPNGHTWSYRAAAELHEAAS